MKCFVCGKEIEDEKTESCTIDGHIVHNSCVSNLYHQYENVKEMSDEDFDAMLMDSIKL